QNMAFTFTGAVGQRVSFSLAQSSGLAWAKTVCEPDGTRVSSANCCGNTCGETGNLPQAGTYKIFLDPVGALTGTLTITAYDVPPYAFQAITPPNALTSSPTRRSSDLQNMAFTFTGAVGQRVSFSLAQSSGLAWATTVYNPDGSILWGTNCCGNTSALFTTTQSGTHKVLVDPVTTAVGSMTGSVALTGGAL